MADLFQTSRTNIVEHIAHIYEEFELDENSTCRKFRQVRKEGNREVSREMSYYNLDMIISLGLPYGIHRMCVWLLFKNFDTGGTAGVLQLLS